ncbi:MAG: hypothetical protein GY696_02210 [Gammaproteobacteria bacterium]|nr:hypothetical protein [Gammaproteobacteria bacterium]
MQLMDKLAEEVKEPYLRRLLWFYMQRTVEDGGIYRTIHKGLSRGCPLSPLMGALFLRCLDEQFEGSSLYYVRYIDDILILAPTRWKLRKAVKRLNQTLADHGMEKHPDKTFIGQIDKGFDFLGYHHSKAGLSLATKTFENFISRLTRLYEQKKTAPDVGAALGEYVRRWLRWVQAALGEELTLPFCLYLTSPADTS